MRQLTKTAIFIATPMKKHILQFILPKGIFYQLVDRKVVGLNGKVLPIKPGFYFFLTSDKNE